MWSEVWAVCEVCKRLDGNLTPKQAKYCRICQAWLCHSDFWDPVRRAKALLKGAA